MRRIVEKEFDDATDRKITRGWIEHRDGAFVGSGTGARTLRAMLMGGDPCCSLPVSFDMGDEMLQTFVDAGEGYKSWWEFVDAPASPEDGEICAVNRGGKWVEEKPKR